MNIQLAKIAETLNYKNHFEIANYFKFKFGGFFEILVVQKVCKSCRSRQELSNEYSLAKIGVDTAENEPLKVWKKIQFIIHSPP